MSIENPGSVQRHLADMITVERRIEKILSQRQEQAKEHNDVAAALKRFQATARGHWEALEDRLQSLRKPSDSSGRQEDGGISEVLCQLYGAFGEAALGYAILHALAHRSFDREGEGNTRDLAKKHLRDYAEAANDINQLVSDAVIWELDRTGEECRCQCTTCALGICTCAPMGVGRANKEWLDTVSSGALGSILVTAPRRESAAASAGLRAGDVILAADGQEIHANSELHAAIKKHQDGESIRLRVRRVSGGVQDITLTC